MVRGSALSLSITPPPSSAPQRMLCFPYENCQLDRFIATYESKRRARFTCGVGVSGGTGHGGGIMAARPKSAIDIACRAASGSAGASGECWYSPLKYTANGPFVAHAEIPETLLNPCCSGLPKS